MVHFGQSIGLVQRALSRSHVASWIAVKIKNQCDMIIAQHMRDGIWAAENGEAWLLRLVAPHCRSFVDVGGNVGQWSVAFARHMTSRPQGLIFEPSPETAKMLRNALAAEAFELEVIESAVGDRVGRVAFYAEAGPSLTSGLYNAAAGSEIEVAMTTLDAELAKRGVAEVDFLKIDTEGNDLNVLLGAKTYFAERRIKVVQFEYNAQWLYAGATLSRAFDFLQSHGYKIRLLKRQALGEMSVREIGEYYCYSNFVAYCRSEIADLLDRQQHLRVLGP